MYDCIVLLRHVWFSGAPIMLWPAVKSIFCFLLTKTSNRPIIGRCRLSNGRYRLLANWPIIGRYRIGWYRLSADNRCTSSVIAQWLCDYLPYLSSLRVLLFVMYAVCVCFSLSECFVVPRYMLPADVASLAHKCINTRSPVCHLLKSSCRCCCCYYFVFY